MNAVAANLAASPPGAQRVEVALGDGRGYPILLGDGILGAPGVLAPHVGSQALIVTNPAVGRLFLPTLLQALGGSQDRQVDVVEIGDGEEHKNLATYAKVLDALVEQRHNRTTTVLALGGGVVGDVAGFAAATYQRGVGLMQIPTTLLALVDSSVGGKTAVNHPGGKNLIGAFHQPNAVVADVCALRTLPARELAAGIAEVVKYGVIADAAFFAWLEVHIDRLLARDPQTLLHAVRRSCEIKAQVVAADEREQGRRAVLNFGHTFGHAVEALGRYRRHLHGEAVAIGMAMAMELSVRLGRAAPEDAARVRRLLAAAGLPLQAAGFDATALREAMDMDKKVRDGRLRLVVCDGLGRSAITDAAPNEAVLAAIESGVGECD